MSLVQTFSYQYQITVFGMQIDDISVPNVPASVTLFISKAHTHHSGTVEKPPPQRQSNKKIKYFLVTVS